MRWVEWAGDWGACGFCGRRFAAGDRVALVTAKEFTRCEACASALFERAAIEAKREAGEELALELEELALEPEGGES